MMVFLFMAVYLVYVIYAIYITWNTPFFETMFFFLPLVERAFEGTLTFGDLRLRFGEHGMFGHSLLFILNAYVFNLSVRFELVISMLFTALYGGIAVRLYCKTISKRNIFFYVGFVMILIAMFIQSQVGGITGMSHQVRMGVGFAFLSLFYAEKLYTEKRFSVISRLPLYILIVLSYLIFGTFYTFSWIFAIIIVYSLRMLYGKIVDMKTSYLDYCIEIVLLLCCVIIYFLFYTPYLGGAGVQVTGGIISRVMSLTWFIVVSMGSATLSWDAVAGGHISSFFIYLNSFFMTLAVIVSLVLYVYTKMWKKTLLPPIMILYTVSLFGQIHLGRAGDGVFHAYNGWYNWHTQFLLVAVIWIFMYTIIEKKSFQINFIKLKINTIRNMAIATVLLLLIPISVTHLTFHYRAPHIKAFIEFRIPYLTGEQDLHISEHGLTPLLWPLEETQAGIAFLRENRLNVFRNPDMFHNQVERRIFYTLGSIISFSSPNVNRYLHQGFSHHEDWGVWSNGHHSVFSVALHERVCEDLRLDITFANMFWGSYGFQIIRLYSLERLIDVKVFYPDEYHQSASFIIPSDAISDDNILTLRFEFPNAESPYSLGISPDERLLAVGFRTLMLSRQLSD